MPLEPGQALSHYRLIEQIGAGGMGIVWRAVDTTLDREVAIQFGVGRLPDDPHSALADLLDDAVVHQVLSGFDGHR